LATPLTFKLEYLNWNKILPHFFLLILLLGIGGESYAQDFTVFPREDYYGSRQQERAFSEAHWGEAIKDIDYSESVRGERIQDENFFTDGTQQNRQERIFETNTEGSAIWAMIFKFLIIAAGLFIVALIIARFLGPEGLGKPRSRRIDPTDLEINLANIEDNIHDSDLQQFIKQAVDQDNYNLAIRLYYLAIIKELSLSKIIRWKRDKTNRAYVGEISTQPYLQEFKLLTIIFERSWYGNRPITEFDFLALKPRYETLINTVQEQGKQAAIARQNG